MSLLCPPPATAQRPAVPRVRCTIYRISDGDTIRCVEGHTKVRLLLIDAPEMDQGPFGVQAQRALQSILPLGSVVALEYDVAHTDQFGRTLAYAWRPDGVMVNEEMVRSGYAVPLTYAPNVKYVERIRAAARTARAGRLGLWNGSAFDCSPRDHRAHKC